MIFKQEATLLEEQVISTAPHKRPSRAQARLAREFASDLIRFERPFRVDLLKIFNRMGIEIERIANEILEPEPGKDNLSMNMKQPAQDALDASAIIEALNIAGFEVELEDVYKKHYGRILGATLKRVNAFLDLRITIPEPLEAEILSAGGKNVGLLDLKKKTQRKIFEELSIGRDQGEAVAQLARRLRDFVPSGRFKTSKIRATLIARTETANAQNLAAHTTYREAGVQEVLILDSRLGSFDQTCDDINGTIVSLERGRQLMVEEHPNGTRSMIAQPPPIIEDLGK